ncbi:methylated-DNA--[protein]-cysteine S-methyltransferase [Psychromicrobium sp. YIM B11713]|uniref:methylated-DNA--[protein]-cysteine S-methyltransferase n=1 Tax=Psychromicrobium sp. YIM B11713 TaxID=3145233 RepID=UPI00374F6C1D
METVYTQIESPLGTLTLLASEDALTGLYFSEHKKLPDRAQWGSAAPDAPLLLAAHKQLEEYFSGRRRSFELPLETRGSELQERVWTLLRDLDYGQTIGYGELAKQLGDPSLAQAVGAAVGANPLSILIPCHRVIAQDGKLTGYAGGIERKVFLLELEESEESKAQKLF